MQTCRCTHFRHPPDKPYLFFFTDPATTEIYTLSLHDALPISSSSRAEMFAGVMTPPPARLHAARGSDRKSTRLNSSHVAISYAVFCLKKKKKTERYWKKP